MKKISFLFLIILVGLTLNGCKKSNSDSGNASVDPASIASGTYTGWNYLSTVDSIRSTTVITKLSASTVTLSITVMNVTNSFVGVTVSNGDNGKILFSQSINSLTGTSSVKSFVFSINGAKFFSGYKP
jgi:hypothetical protein